MKIKKGEQLLIKGSLGTWQKAYARESFNLSDSEYPLMKIIEGKEYKEFDAIGKYTNIKILNKKKKWQIAKT
jgi:hypothetical protein